MSDLFDEWGVDDDSDADDLDADDEYDAEEFEFEEEDFEDDDFDEVDDGHEDDLGEAGEGDDDLALDDLDLLGDDDDLDGDELGSALAGSVAVSCPYCGAGVELLVDPVGGDIQEYVEDCEVCCQPWSVRVSVDAEGTPSVDVSTLDEV